MLIRCNPKCKLNDGMTDASLDIDSNDVICNHCGDVIGGVTEFTKTGMKSNKDIIKKNKKAAFVFKCDTCEDMVEVCYLNSKIKGKNCLEQNCKINISDFMKTAIIQTNKTMEKYKEDEQDSQGIEKIN